MHEDRRIETTSEALAASDDRRSRSPRRPGQTLACGWCGSPAQLPARGRIPKWCSSSCRHRAWELTLAAASGHAAVQIVHRVVEVDKPSPVIEQVLVSPRGPLSPTHWPPSSPSWTPVGCTTGTCLPLADALGQVLNALTAGPDCKTPPPVTAPEVTARGNKARRHTTHRPTPCPEGARTLTCQNTSRTTLGKPPGAGARAHVPPTAHDSRTT